MEEATLAEEYEFVCAIPLNSGQGEVRIRHDTDEKFSLLLVKERMGMAYTLVYDTKYEDLDEALVEAGQIAARYEEVE
ncbi:MAG: hypothetical protein ACXABY_10780 [Candidatus Thorarchaeota archaeon]|jgi:hypothetical protein